MGSIKNIGLVGNTSSKYDNARKHIIIGKYLMTGKEGEDYIESAKIAFEKALKIGEEINNYNIIRSCYYYLGRVFLKKEVYDISKEYFTKALGKRKKSKCSVLKGQAYLGLSATYFKLEDYVEAIKYAKKSLKIGMKKRHRKLKRKSSVILGLSYMNLNKYRKAKKYFSDVLNYCSRRKEEGYGKGDIYPFLGFCCYGLKEEEGIIYLKKGLLYAKRNKNKEVETLCHTCLGDIYLFNLSEYKKAKDHYEKSIKYINEMNEKKEEIEKLNIILMSCYLHLGYIYIVLENEKKGMKYLEKALNISREIKNEEEEINCLVSLGYAFESVENYKKAIEFFEKAKEISAKINNKEDLNLCYKELKKYYKKIGDFDKVKEYEEKLN